MGPVPTLIEKSRSPDAALERKQSRCVRKNPADLSSQVSANVPHHLKPAVS
jgi:hypothetical protein